MTVKSMERFLLLSDRLPQLLLLPGVVDIEMLGGTLSFKGVFGAAGAGAPAEEVEASKFDTPSFEGVFGVAPGRPVVFKFAAAEEPTDEAEVNEAG